MNTARNGFPFTAAQWQELEHQVLIFKYMVSGIPIPSDLLYAITRSFDSSLSSKLLLHQPHHIGWSCFQMGFGRKIDPEPGRCRRTDGKKWRCSKEAYLDSKYCERHMHRGRNRSRKPVEAVTITPSSTNSSSSTSTSTALPFSSFTIKNSPSSPSRPTSHSFASLPLLASEPQPQDHSFQHPFLCYRSSGSPKSHFSSQDNITNTTKFVRESDAYSYNQRAKMKVDELPFFSETTRTMRSNVLTGTSKCDSWQLAPLTMGSSGTNVKQSSCSEVSNEAPLQFMERDDQTKKVVHHFFDEWSPKERNSWLDNDDKLPTNGASSNFQLSISIPTPSSHDFFLTRNNENALLK